MTKRASRARRDWNRSLLAGVGLAAVVVIAASCGSDNGTSAGTTVAPTTAAATTAAPGTTVGPATTAAGGATTTAGGSGNDCVDAANEFLKPYDTPPTKLPDDFTPLSKKPAPGGTIINLYNGTIPSDGETAQEMVTAAGAVGWTAKKINFDGSVEDLNAKFQQAVAEKPTVIAMAGFPVAAIQAGIDAAKAAGVIVSLASITDPVISNPGYAASSNGPDAVRLLEEVNANLLMRDSQCAGKVLSISAPFPIITVGLDQFNQTLKEKCPNCASSDLEVQPKDIGTPALTNQIVSKLQSDPSIKYVHATFSNLATGLDAALDQANLKGIGIFGNVPDTNAVKALQEGRNAWWLTQNSTTQAWQELDAALRVLDTGQVATTKSIPFAVLTPENVDKNSSEVPSYPTNFRDLFKQVWQVG